MKCVINVLGIFCVFIFVYATGCTKPVSVEAKRSPKPIDVSSPTTQSESAPSKKWQSLPAGQVDLRIQLEGMSCQACANSAAEIARELSGVLLAKGSFEEGALLVRFEKGKIAPQKIADAISSASSPRLKSTVLDDFE